MSIMSALQSVENDSHVWQGSLFTHPPHRALMAGESERAGATDTSRSVAMNWLALRPLS